MPKIFISYRRDDSSEITGRIREQLVRKFGKQNVFRDLNSIPLGSDFRDVIEEGVTSCDILLAIIGDQWVNITDKKTATKRLDNPDDFVRIEVETALRIHRIKVIPVLVNGARMPTEAELPSTLRKLPYLNAAVIRNDPDFDNDVTNLIASLSGSGYSRWLILAVIVIGLLIIGLGLFLSQGNHPQPAATDAVLDVPTETVRNPTTPTNLVTDRPTDTPFVPSNTPAPTDTAASPTTMPTNTPLPTSDTPPPLTATTAPTNTQSPPTVPTATILVPTPALQADTVQLRLFVDRDSFTLYVPQAISLEGLQFKVVSNSSEALHTLRADFPVLSFTQDNVEAGTCFIYKLVNAQSPLSFNCDQRDRIFLLQVAPADIFWFDTLAGQAQVFAIYKDNQSTGQICSFSAAQFDCSFNWPARADIVPTVTVAFPTMTSVANEYPCTATVKNNDSSQVTILKIVRSQPVYSVEPTTSVRVGQSVSVLKQELEGTRTVWYLIADDQQRELGYVLEDYLDLSASCPV